MKLITEQEWKDAVWQAWQTNDQERLIQLRKAFERADVVAVADGNQRLMEVIR